MTDADGPDAIHPLEVLRAGRWTRALFGTFALSLGFFEAAPLRSLRRAGANDIRILADISGVAASVGEAGAREIGRTYLLDAISVSAGCFHPKFILLDGEEGPRLIVGSGNLTFGGWGRNLELCEVLSPATAPAAFLDMADFLESLATAPRLDYPAGDAAASWATALRRLPETAADSGIRLLHNVDQPIADQLVEMARNTGGATRLLVASPYFGGAGAVRALAEQLGVERAQVHVSSAVALAGSHYDFDRDVRAEPVIVAELDEGRTQRPLHAKLIEIECRDAILCLSGSVNATGPALTRAANVELAVVRTTSVPASTTPFIGALPPISNCAEAESSKSTLAVLSATMIGRTLSGLVIGDKCTGVWSARLDATGEFRDLGEVEVGLDRRFEINVPTGEDISFGTRRAILVLSNGSRRIAGFVNFPDLLELNRRWGASAGSMMRVVGGSSEDEDMAGVLEYFARHPDQTATPWGLSRPPKQAEEYRDDRVVPLEELDVRPRAEAPAVSESGWGSTAIDRLIAAIRRTIVGAGARGGAPRGHDEEGEDELPGEPPPPPPPGRTERIFETLCEAFATRVPQNPQTELHRLAELGLCVLARRPDAARFADYISWWCSLASAHLRCDADRIDLRRLATLLILIDGMNAGTPLAARRRIAMTVGNVEDAVNDARSPIPPLLLVLLEEASAGLHALDEFLGQVERERTAVEELPALLEAIRSSTSPPPLPVLDREPEMAQIRRKIASGFAGRIPIASRSDTCCPKCRIGMPQADIERLRAIGMVVARNCCGGVVVLDRDL